MSNLEVTMMKRIGELNKENARLKAEVERLTKQNALATPRHLIASQDIKTLREQIEELKLENSQYEEHHKYGQNVITSLREEVERLKEGNECLDQMHEKEMARSAFLCEEVNRTTAWGRGLESDLSWARAELMLAKAEVERLTDLKAEADRLKAEVERLTKESDILQKCCEHQKNRIARLKAEVERLTKAGDAMASSIQFNEEMAQDYNGPTIVHQSVQRWNAAKEGKAQP